MILQTQYSYSKHRFLTNNIYHPPTLRIINQLDKNNLVEQKLEALQEVIQYESRFEVILDKKGDTHRINLN